jgi:hypothetical protein
MPAGLRHRWRRLPVAVHLLLNARRALMMRELLIVARCVACQLEAASAVSLACTFGVRRGDGSVPALQGWVHPVRCAHRRITDPAEVRGSAWAWSWCPHAATVISDRSTSSVSIGASGS